LISNENPIKSTDSYNMQWLVITEIIGWVKPLSLSAKFVCATLPMRVVIYLPKIRQPTFW